MMLTATIVQAMHTTGSETNSFNIAQNIVTSMVINARENDFAIVRAVELGGATCMVMVQTERSITAIHEAISNISDLRLVIETQTRNKPTNKTN
jgi:hypothetical protein